MKRAIYAFSGDPITYGHIDIIKRASKGFDEIVVAIGVNPDKKYMFSLDERKEMAEKSLAGIPSTKVVSFEGLLVDYAYENDIPVIIKGIRDQVDTDYEKIIHQVGESQELDIETYILFARPELSHISSSTVKAIQKEHGRIEKYVPLYVKQCLEAKMSGQYIVGITGEIGAGKSYVSEKFIQLGKERDIEVHNIELDHIVHRIYDTLEEPRYVKIRMEIAEVFGDDVMLPDSTIDRKALGDIVFYDQEKLARLNELIYTPLMVRVRKELYGKKGVILLNAALTAESDMAYMSNNNIVVVTADNESKDWRLTEKGLTQEQIGRRLKSQYSSEEKIFRLEKTIEKSRHGKVWTIDNSDSVDPYNIEKVFKDVLKELKIR